MFYKNDFNSVYLINLEKESFPKSLSEIDFSNFKNFNQNIKKDILHKYLETLTLGYHFNKEI